MPKIEEQDSRDETKILKTLGEMSFGAQVAHVDNVPLDHDMKESKTGTHRTACQRT